MISSILVLGGGSAGFLAAITLKKRMPHMPITILRSPEIGIIGVGEGSTPVLTHHLHGYLGIDPGEFHRVADPQWKLGIRFQWGPRPWFDYAFHYQLDSKYHELSRGTGFYCEDSFEHAGIATCMMSRNAVFPRQNDGQPNLLPFPAYHLENEKFVGFLEMLARRMGVVIQEETVQEVIESEHGVAGLRLASGTVAAADFFVDCSGFASVLLSKTFQEPFVSFKPSLFCDRAVIGGWDRVEEPIQPYTLAQTMDAGWCWRIDHERRINRGYVYSSAFISDEQAEAEFRAKNPRLTRTRLVKFVTGRYERNWVKNVCAIGNASGFVEPLEATSLAVICNQSQALAESIASADQDPPEVMIRQYNRRKAQTWEQIRKFLSVHYRFNARLDTPFWRECREKTDIGPAEEFVEYFRELGPDVVWRHTLLDVDDPYGMEGYLSLLVGQKVPYRRTYRPPPAEQGTLQQIRAALDRMAASAFTVPQALSLIRSPAWKWPANLFAAR